MTDRKFTDFDLEKATAELNHALHEAAYVAVGLGVLGFQRAQVQRVELMKQVEPYVAAAREQIAEARTQLTRMSVDLPDPDEVRGQLTDLAKAVDEALTPVRHQLDEQFDRLEVALPETARNLVHSVRAVASTQGQAFRTRVGL